VMNGLDTRAVAELANETVKNNAGFISEIVNGIDSEVMVAQINANVDFVNRVIAGLDPAIKKALNA
jgi:predicted Rossmann fold nucleotide-binding protein DprA/Smf involved in DNA uptake